MSGNRPDIPDELHILAGEYVLGALDEAEMRAVRRRAGVDPALAAAIAAWERRLAPLADAVPPAAPPPALWERLERAIAETPPAEASIPTAQVVPLAPHPRHAPPAPRPRRVWPWQLATVASLAVAAGVAAFAFVPQVPALLHLAPPPARVAALLPAEAGGGVFLARAQPDGTVVLTALAPVTVPDGHALELWILRPGAKTPTSLGVLPAAGRRVALPAPPPEGTQLLVSLEPPGGSPTGLPTGRVLYAGALTQLAL